MRIQVLGLTRWSYPFASGDFRTDGTLDTLRATLYAPDRLDHALVMLKHVLIPCLQAQSTPDFTHLVLLGADLPEPWRSEALALLATVPQVIPIIESEGQGHRNLCRKIIKAHIDPACDVVAQYRLDDDDGIATDFVAQTRARFGDLHRVFAPAGRLALDFTRGFILNTTQAEPKLTPASMRFWAPGMGIFLRPDDPRALMDFNHLKVWHRMPTLSLPSDPMFIRGAHAFNDSHLPSFARRVRGFPFEEDDLASYVRQRFGLDLPALRDGLRSAGY